MYKFLSKLRCVSQPAFTVRVMTYRVKSPTDLTGICYSQNQCFRSDCFRGFSAQNFNRYFSAEAKPNEQSEKTMHVVEDINESLFSKSPGRLFAVIHIAGRQRKITMGDIIVLDKPLEADIGEDIRINKVLMVGSSNFTFVGRPLLSDSLVKIEATVLEKTLSHPIVSFWYKKRRDFRRLYLRKQFYTFLRIKNIEIQNPTNA